MSKPLPQTPSVEAVRLAVWLNYSPLSERLFIRIATKVWWGGHNPESDVSNEQWEEILAVGFYGPQFLRKPVEALLFWLEKRSSKTFQKWAWRKMTDAKYPSKIWRRRP